MTKNGDLPAMPTQYNGGDLFGGLTKREMMAMHMMASMSEVYWAAEDEYSSGAILIKCQAESAVEMVDALLAELERTK